jgi:hypothetical protein
MRREIMDTQGQRTTQSPARSTCASVAALLSICAGGAVGGVVFEPAPSNFENALLMLAGASMRSTVGPVSVEGDGVLRYTTGLYPPETIELNLPELRSASPLDALRWSNRWREIIEGTFGGEREMVNYWEQGATIQGEPLFSVLHVGDAFLSSDNGRSPATFSDADGASVGVGRAVQFARGGAAGGGGGGGGGGGSSTSPFAAPANPQPSTPSAPVIDPNVLPPSGGSGSGDSTGEAPAGGPATQPPRFGLSFGEIEWVNPTFNRTPAPPRPENGDGNPFDDQDGSGAGSPIAIPTPTAVGLGFAGLLAIGVSSRRRRRVL